MIIVDSAHDTLAKLVRRYLTVYIVTYRGSDCNRVTVINYTSNSSVKADTMLPASN